MDEQAQMVNCTKYLKTTFKPFKTHVLKIFVMHAEILKQFVEYYEKDLKLTSDFKSVDRYSDHGVEHLCKLLIGELGGYLKSDEFILEELLLIYYNIYQFENSIAKKYLNEKFNVNKNLNDGFRRAKDQLYERIIVKLNKDIDFNLSNFVVNNFKRKNALNAEAQYFEKFVNTFKVC